MAWRTIDLERRSMAFVRSIIDGIAGTPFDVALTLWSNNSLMGVWRNEDNQQVAIVFDSADEDPNPYPYATVSNTGFFSYNGNLISYRRYAMDKDQRVYCAKDIVISDTTLGSERYMAFEHRVIIENIQGVEIGSYVTGTTYVKMPGNVIQFKTGYRLVGGVFLGDTFLQQQGIPQTVSVTSTGYSFNFSRPQVQAQFNGVTFMMNQDEQLYVGQIPTLARSAGVKQPVIIKKNKPLNEFSLVQPI